MGRLDALKHGTRTRPDEPDTEREWSVPSFVPKAQTAGCGSAPSSPSFSRALGTRIVIASWLLTPPAPAESPSAFHFHRGGGWPPTTAARATPRRRRRRPPPPPPPVELASTIWRTRGSSAAYAWSFCINQLLLHVVICHVSGASIRLCITPGNPIVQYAGNRILISQVSANSSITCF